MSNGIKIPIDGDLSGLNQAITEFGAKAKQVLGGLSGTATIDTKAATASMQELQGAAKKMHDMLNAASGKGVAPKGIDKLVADLAQAAAQAGKIEQALGGMGAKGGNSLSRVVAETQKMATEMRRAAEMRERLAKVNFKASLGQAAEFIKDADFHRENNASPAMRRKLRSIGSIENLMDGGWKGLGRNEMDSRRLYNEYMRGLGINMPGGAPGTRSFGQFFAQHAQRAGGAVLGAVMPNTGVAGSIAQSAAGEASATPGGLLSGAGIARLGGGLGMAAVAFGAVRAAMAVKGKMDSSEQESIGYSDLLRQMGATANTFEQLRESVRGAGKELDLSFGDAATMGTAYVRGGGLDGLPHEQLGGELRTAGNFSRAMGLDMSAGAGMFAQLRHSKVSGSDADNKRFALMIGEAVGRAGVFTKADEVLSAVANYTDRTTRASMGPANTGAYVGALGNLMNLRQAGLDPQGAAAMLGTVDGAFRAGGGGEAQRNFLLGALQRNMPGMNALDMGFMQDAGMFATAKGVFGKGSAAYESADAGTRARYEKLAAAGGDKTFYDMAMGQLGGMSSDEQRLNMKGLFGLNDSQAAMLQQATSLHGGNLSKTMLSLTDKYGIDPAKMSGSSLRNVLDVEFAQDPGALRAKGQFLRAQGLSAPEEARLKAAEAGGDIDELKRTLIDLGKNRNMEMTDGDVSRKNMASLENLTSDMATKLIPATNAIREAVVATANVLTFNRFKDKFGPTQQAQSAFTSALSKLAPTDTEGRSNLYLREKKRIAEDEGSYTDEYKKMINEGVAASSQKIDARPRAIGGGAGSGAQSIAGDKAEFLRKTAGAAQRAAARINAAGGNVKPEWLQAQWGLETGWGSSLLKGTNNLGNIKAGGGWNGAASKFNVLEQAQDGTVYRENAAFRSYSSLDEAANDYAGVLTNKRYREAITAGTPSGFAQAMGSSGYATDQGYGRKLESTIQSIEKMNARSKGTPLPADAPKQSAPAQEVKVSLNGEFYLNNRETGMPMANPIMISSVSAPRAAGLRGAA